MLLYVHLHVATYIIIIDTFSVILKMIKCGLYRYLSSLVVLDSSFLLASSYEFLILLFFKIKKKEKKKRERNHGG